MSRNASRRSPWAWSRPWRWRRSAIHCLVVPLIIEIPDDGGEFRRYLVEQGKGIGLVRAIAVETGSRHGTCTAPLCRPPGKYPSQIPTVLWAKQMAPLSQPLNSPMTLTCLALGAQTAKYVPRVAVAVDGMGAELVVQAKVAAFVKQIEIVVREQAHGVWI
jgi:hypothetical protein